MFNHAGKYRNCPICNPKPAKPAKATQDIDSFLRYGEGETPEIARYLEYER